MDERVKFYAEVLKGERQIKNLCQQYGSSRKTGYKWIEGISLDGLMVARRGSGKPLKLDSTGEAVAHAADSDAVLDPK